MIADDVVQFLQVDLGQGASVFLERLPDTPDRAVAIYSRSGGEPNANVALRYPRLQIIVRDPASDPRDGFDLAKRVYDLLHAFAPGSGLAGSEERLLLCRALQEPYSIGRDAKGRSEWTINFELITTGEI